MCVCVCVYVCVCVCVCVCVYLDIHIYMQPVAMTLKAHAWRGRFNCRYCYSQFMTLTNADGVHEVILYTALPTGDKRVKRTNRHRMHTLNNTSRYFSHNAVYF